MASTRVPGVLCGYEQDVNVHDGTLCLAPSPVPGVVGSFSGVAGWPLERKLIEAAKRAIPALPAGMRDEFAALFTGESLAILTVVLVAWAAGHAFGVSEIIDAVLLAVGIVMLGSQALRAFKAMGAYLDRAMNARSDADLDAAGAHLAEAVAIIGVTAFTALIFKAAKRIKGGGGGGQGGKGGVPPVEEPPPSSRAKTPARQGGQETGAASETAAGKKTGSAGAAEESAGAKPKKTAAPKNAVEEMAAKEGSGSLAIAARRRVMQDYFAEQNKMRPLGKRMSRAEIESKINGVDLTKPVTVVKIPPEGLGPKGNQLVQWQTPGRTGEWFTDNPNTTPNQLGISAKTFDSSTGKVVPRERVVLEVPPGQEVRGIKSTAAPIEDTWSLKNTPVKTDGGGSQIVIGRGTQPQWIKASE
ncbi:MAG: hypothetical protein IT581_00965 [Verrucomicrobiales bacterium]|nr:hypothetical protein [Verrucomicrobiales bacterium]